MTEETKWTSYSNLSEFIVKVKYGLNSGRSTEKIEHKAKKLYRRIERKSREGFPDGLVESDASDDEFYDIAHNCFNWLMNVPLFIQNLHRFWDEYYMSIADKGIAKKMLRAFVLDRQILDRVREHRVGMGRVAAELESMPPCSVLPAGGVEFQRAESDFMSTLNRRVRVKSPLSRLQDAQP